ncbi:lysophospholipid acyltransferase family protein [Treponema sp.]
MLKTIIYFTFFWISFVLALPIGLVALLLRLLGLKQLIARPLQKFARLWASILMFLTGSQLEVKGLENIPSEGGVCFVGNHPGDFDILIAIVLIDRPFGFTAKKEALYFPFVGLWVWLLGGVFIDRKSARKGFLAIKEGASAIEKGGAMIIFPEGTRNRGKGLLPFRAGAFKLATMAQSPIVPLSIVGSHEVWETTKRIKAAKVKISFGPPIPTSHLSPEQRRALPDLTRKVIQDMLDSM